jgi:uncharacterized protein (DUF488 family)
MENPVIYTVGHSTHPLDYFLSLLQAYAVDCLVDVRSVAASAHNPQYNKESLSEFVKDNGIAYLHFPREFGARYKDSDLLDENGKVDFEKVRRSAHFRHGVDRIWRGVENGYTISLMCSESNPLECHRFSMISVALEKSGLRVQHIMKDKTLRSSLDLEQLLLEKYDAKLPKPDMFQPNITREDQLKVAYRLINIEIGFSPHLKEAPSK